MYDSPTMSTSICVPARRSVSKRPCCWPRRRRTQTASCSAAELDDVLGHLAAEANHTHNRRRRVLDAVYARLEDALAGRDAALAMSPDTAPRDAIMQGIADVLGLTPDVRERVAHMLAHAADEAVLELGFRRRIAELFEGGPATTGQHLRLALDLGELVDRIRATGAARPEVACSAVSHLLGRLRAAADALPDAPALRAACAQLGETAIALAHRAGPDLSRRVLAALLDAYLADHLGYLHDVPVALQRARLGKRTAAGSPPRRPRGRTPPTRPARHGARRSRRRWMGSDAAQRMRASARFVAARSNAPGSNRSPIHSSRSACSLRVGSASASSSSA